LLGLGFVFASNDGSATIGIIMFVAEDLNFVIQSGAVDGLNLYVYVNNNPLKYTDPTGHGINTISNDNFFQRINKATIGIIMFVAEDLNFVIQFQDVGL
jgi:hypothetical protein